MENEVRDDEEDTRRLVVAITDFLRDQLIVRTDLVPEDRDCLEIAIQCLEMAYGLEARRYVQYRFSRPLLDVFNQVTNPVSIRDKLRADAHKDEGNSYMRRNMFSNAENEYTQAIELDRWNAIYYCNRASSRIEQQNYFEAISDCRQALMLNPDYAKAHARMGQAYALIHRPREAARCFRQAVEMEPENERYRNNLRVAESQISRPDAVGLITTLLSSLFGATPRDPNDPSSTISMPTSFMIITESHPPTREDPSESNEPAESEHSAESDQVEKIVSSHSSSEAQNIVYPPTYGIIDEGSEEQPILQIDLPTGENASLRGDREMTIDIPYYILQPEHPVTPHPSLSSQEETVGQKTSDEKETSRIQHNESPNVEYSESKKTPTHQTARKEDEILNAKIKVSREEDIHRDSKEAAENRNIPSSSTEPPRLKPDYTTDSEIVKDADENVQFIYGNEKSTEQPNKSALPDTDGRNENNLKPPVDDIVVPVTSEAQKKEQMLERGTDEVGLLKQERSDSKSDEQKPSLSENDCNADSEGHDQQSNGNETGNVPNAQNRNTNKERRDDNDNSDDAGSIR